MSLAAKLEDRLEQALETIEGLMRENKILRDEVAILKKGVYGRSSERLSPGQLGFFDASNAAPEVSSPTPHRKLKKESGHGRTLFPAQLPREIINLDLPENERICSCCGKPMKCIGESETERGHIIPAQLVVHKYIRRKYACPDGHEMRTASLPDGVIDGGKYEASVYAHIATAKYSDHLPLHRLEGIFKRYDVHIAKQSMWDMLVRLDELAAQPILKQMRLELLQEDVLHADETPVTMRLEDGKGTKQGYAWGWRNLHREDQPAKALIEFKTSRGRDGPVQFLGDWCGTLIIDGYTGYNEAIQLNGIIRAGCWSHVRRKFKEALDTGAQDATGPLELIQKLFEIERPINGSVQAQEINRKEQLERRSLARSSESRLTLDLLYAEAERLMGLRSTLPKSKLGKALGYLLSQRRPLSAFLDDPRLPIHNNDSERDLRHLAIGRNNWMVFGSKRGGEVACRLYSLMLSCKQCGVNPEAYLADVLMKVATTPASKIATLTPWAWQAVQREG